MTLEAGRRSKTGDNSSKCLISSTAATSDITSCSDQFGMETVSWAMSEAGESGDVQEETKSRTERSGAM